jgi:hypothetical protein
MIMMVNWEGFGRKGLWHNFKVLFWHSSGGTEENHKKSHRATWLPGPRIKARTYPIRSRSVDYSRQTMRWSVRGVNILSAVRGKYRACRWTEDFLLVSAKVT